MTDKTVPPHDVLAPLLAYGDLKVWSVLVTILGDLSAQKGASISGPSLSALTTRMGIRPEALRVALHRLRKDGWIRSEKSGRISHYGLSDHGRAETLRVQDRVYAAQRPRPERWHLAMLPANATQTPEQPCIPLGRNAFLMPALRASPPQVQQNTLLADVTSDKLPDWVQEAALPAQSLHSYQTWLETLGRLPKNPETLAPLDQLALRILALHHWRRIVLRHNDLVDAVMPVDWVGAACRARMVTLLASLPRQTL